MLARSLVLSHPAEMISVAVTRSHVFVGVADGTVSAWMKPSLSYVGALRQPHYDDPSLSSSFNTSSVMLSEDKSRQPPSDGGIGGVTVRNMSESGFNRGKRQPFSVVSLVACDENQMIFVGGALGEIYVWQDQGSGMEFRVPVFTQKPTLARNATTKSLIMQGMDSLPSALSRFVAFRTVSGDPMYRVDCFQGAKWLRNYLISLGFDARLDQPAVSGYEVNPIVYAKIGDNPALKTVLIYGHYDVVPAGAGWKTDPWRLHGVNGFLYGRGATDNKGPMLAAMMGVSQLLESGTLKCNIRFLLEGEEENGSRGVLESLARNSSYIGKTDLVLISNNYWIGDDRPCITYGLRGVVHMKVSVSGPKHSTHSGVDGGVFREPMMDLMQIIASMTDPKTGRVAIPGFYDDVRPLTAEEMLLYEDIDFDVRKYGERTGLTDLLTSTSATELLMQRWRFPTLSVTGIELPAGGNPTIIPKKVTARISVRTVPDQDHKRLIALLNGHLEAEFAKLNSRNKLKVNVIRDGAWWLGDVKGNPFYKAAEVAIEKAWGKKPMFTREGGTIPLFSELESLLKCQGLILPLGQSQDNAHLPNERISLECLLKGVEVFKELFQAE